MAIGTNTPTALIHDDDHIPRGWQYSNQTATTTGVTIKTGKGMLHAITFNNPVATGVITLYDNTAASGTKIATITVPASPQPVTLTYDIAFTNGLEVVIATAAQDLTISYI